MDRPQHVAVAKAYVQQGQRAAWPHCTCRAAEPSECGAPRKSKCVYRSEIPEACVELLKADGAVIHQL